MTDLISTEAGTAPAVIKVQTVVVYGGADGRIVHKHEVITLAGGASTSDDEVAADALEHARRNGHRPDGLATLHVDAAAFKRDTGYRVDPSTRRSSKSPRCHKLSTADRVGPRRSSGRSASPSSSPPPPVPSRDLGGRSPEACHRAGISRAWPAPGVRVTSAL
jgi:hypothetical protein